MWRGSRATQHILSRVKEFESKVAILSASTSNTYKELCVGAWNLSQKLLNGQRDLNQQRIAFVSEPNANYIKMQWAIWGSGGIAVPLHRHHPIQEMEYMISDSQATQIVADDVNASKLCFETPNLHVINHDDNDNSTSLPEWDLNNIRMDRAAQILYTSGTTGRPKGVVMTHGNLHTQMADITQAWKITQADKVLHFLPLHHTHGILNNLLSPLSVGATVEMLPSAEAPLIWSKLAQSANECSQKKISMLMAVPTIYMNLLESIQAFPDRPAAIQGARDLRLSISGSMACPVRIIQDWEQLTGHRLLERYGMTELGMVLTNPLHGERHVGYVGQPFPSVQVKLVDSKTRKETKESGEIRVKGPTVFQRYWNRPEATAAEFDENGWFKTGDIASYCQERSSFRILGRASVDIIKSGGYKLSAIEIEAALLQHPAVAECVVLGLPDEKWGQIVAALVRLSDDDQDLETVQDLARNKLAAYKFPRRWIRVSSIPKNAMGKVNKKELAKRFAETVTNVDPSL